MECSQSSTLESTGEERTFGGPWPSCLVLTVEGKQASVLYRGISVQRIAVGVQSQHNAPAEYWSPSEGDDGPPDKKELADMLSYAEAALVGRPTDICIAIIYEAPGVVGKQLNRRTPYRQDRREDLVALVDKVLDDCVEDAKESGAQGVG